MKKIQKKTPQEPSIISLPPAAPAGGAECSRDLG